MTYNKYTAPQGKVLFNTENFTYGNTILSIHDLNLIVLDEEEAEALYDQYLKEQEAIKEVEQENETNTESIPFKARSNANVALMALNDEGEYEEAVEDDPLLTFRKEKLIELMAKGVNLNPNINKQELTTKHI